MKLNKKDLLLYAITDRTWLNGKTLCSEVSKVLENGATFLQLREKDLSHEEIVSEGIEIKKITDKYRVPFVINDDILAAKEVNCDGVHIGQKDMDYKKAREILGPDKIIGVSCGNVKEAIAAEKLGADYIGVGAVFHTSTKKDARDMTKETLIEISNSVSIPIVAIGGINGDNMDKLKDTGINGVAIISAIFASKDIGSATKKLLENANEIFNY